MAGHGHQRHPQALEHRQPRGCIVGYDDFMRIQENLANAGVKFVVKPYTRYEGKKGEQLTMFFLDYSGNPLEFKSFKNEAEIFDRD